MIALATIAPKLGKLIPLLSSDLDGEVVAAARAIGRTLQSAGTDWHALARLLTAAPTSEASHDLAFVLRCLDGHPGLTEWETNFVASIATQQARGRRVTDKQRAVVIRVWERLQ